MAEGLASGVADDILDALCSSIAWSEPAEFWVKLHTGDPGAAGANNAAANTTRMQASFAAASGGTITTNTDLDWTNVPNAETYAWISYWSAAAAGTFLGSDQLAVARAVAVGDNFSILAGEIDLSLSPIAS